MAGDETYASLAHCVFDEILNAFGQEFIVELYEHEQANIYRSLAIVMQAFWEFERLYLDVPKPVIQPRMVRDRESGEMVSEREEKRRAANRIARNAESLLESCSLDGDVDTEDDGGGGIEDM